MLIAVRHGSTKLNGAHGGERTRGWLPVPLTLQGMQEIAETADALGDLEGVDGLYSSDLVRAVQSAQEIARVLGMELQPTEELRDWNLGDLAGERIASILPQTHHLIDHPDEKAPGGESYNTFLERAVPFLTKLVESKKLNIAVAHNRIITLLAALCKQEGDFPDPQLVKKKGPVDPAGLLIIDPSWKITYTHKQAGD